MQHNAPKTTRNKKLHFVFFVDASRTKSLSIDLRLLAFSGFLLLGSFAAAGCAFYLYLDNTRKLTDTQAFVRELKSSLLAQAMVSQNVLVDGYSKQHAELNERIQGLSTQLRQEAERAVRSAGKAFEDGKTVANGKDSPPGPQVALRALSLEAPQPDASKGTGTDANPHGPQGKAPAGAQASKPMPPSAGAGANGTTLNSNPSSAGGPAGGAGPTTATGSAPGGGPDTSPNQATGASGSGSTTAGGQAPSVTAASPQQAASGKSSAPLLNHTGNLMAAAAPTATGAGKVRFQNFNWVEEDQQTTLEFELVNSAGANQISLSGRVCAVVELKPPSRILTVPPRLPLSAAQQPHKGCQGGELVRFSRLRPTELTFPVPRAQLQKVTLYFSEMGIAKPIAHVVENNNSL